MPDSRDLMQGPPVTTRLTRWLACGVLLMGGCGSQTYEARLEATKQRNAYLSRLDAELQPYAQAGFNVWIRPPKEMVHVPPPVPPKEEGAEMPPDVRQSWHGVDLTLPGGSILAAWDGQLPTAGGDRAPYRILLLGNHSRFLGRDSAEETGDPGQFFTDLELRLQNLFGVTLPPGDGGRGDRPNEKYRVRLPNSDRFAVPKTYFAVNFQSETTDSSETTGLPFQAWLYEHNAQRIQVAVLILAPLNPSNDVRQRLLTSLETLQVSPDVPSAAPRAGGTSAPSMAPRLDF